MQNLPGITREAEEQKLRRTITVAQQKLDASKKSAAALADELHEMLEIFDEEDKETMALWNNTNSMYRQVSLEIRRSEQARRKPYFGRIDFTNAENGEDEVCYIGRSAILKDPAHPEVIDWRAPIAGVYYDSGLGETSYQVKGEGRYEITLSRKRTYEIDQDTLKAFYDSDVVANDDLLTKYLSRNKSAVLGEIIATIQQEQNEVIRKKPQHNMIIQGAAGSGKTTVAMHRISFILYNYELEFAPEDFYIIGSNQMLLNYITGVLPELDVYGVAQMTMEQLFVRLLYEDWDKKYTVKPVQRGVTPPVKGTLGWFCSLEAFCERRERELIPRGDVRIERTGALLMSEADIEKILQQNAQLSRADKISRLTECLIPRLENEIYGKYYSYPHDEQKRLMRFYQTYFGKREWKGSIFDLYDAFLKEQQAKGFDVPLPGTEFDVYDLAALAYLYKRIKEDETIREAGHVIIDEAQDFGMMAYASLKYCLSKCTYTIMGDVSQNISSDYGLNDWSELRSLMLPGEFDYFGLLRKSYRNTIEIAHFATDVLCHGSFQIYPIEPIIRHGNEVRVTRCQDFDGLIAETERTIQGWLSSGLETVSIICSSKSEAQEVSNALSGRLPVIPFSENQTEFGAGVMVLSLEQTKGLEFDAVLLFDASIQNYPAEDGFVKRLYVASTRALHELTVLYQGELTPLIATPVAENVRQAKMLAAAPTKITRPALVKKERTNREIELDLAAEGHREMARRDVYGPRRIEVKKKPDEAAPRQSPQQNPLGSANPYRQNLSGSASPYRQNLSGSANPYQQNHSGSASLYRRSASGHTSIPGAVRPTVKAPAPSSEFGTLPDNNELRPAGHSRIDCSIRFTMKENGAYSLRSSYGTLRVIPLAPDLVRVCFTAGSGGKLPAPPAEFANLRTRYKVRENPGVVEFVTEKLIVRADKKTGALAFLTPQGKLLLAERAREPRQIGPDRVWMFFDWKRKENLIARGSTDKRLHKIGASAVFISLGPDSDRLPALSSSAGYQIFLPPRLRALCCNIPMYGPYLSMEGTDVIDYYFKTGA